MTGSAVYFYCAEVYIPDTDETRKVSGGVDGLSGVRSGEELSKLIEYISEGLVEKFSSAGIEGVEVFVSSISLV